MVFILDEKWLQRSMALLGASVLPTLAEIGHSPADAIFGTLTVICLGIFIARLAWVIRHRRRIALRMSHENQQKVQLRGRFYGILGVLWFVALVAIGHPATWKFVVVCVIAALVIAGYLFPTKKK